MSCPLMKSKGDVDFSTGNIKYNGNVVIFGNVKNGFQVEANGDVEINGNLEGTVSSDCNIQVKGKGDCPGQGLRQRQYLRPLY